MVTLLATVLVALVVSARAPSPPAGPDDAAAPAGIIVEPEPPRSDPPAVATAPPAPQHSASGPEPPATAPADPVSDLLDRLERSAAGLRSFTADVVYVAEDALIGRDETRRGELIYLAEADSGERRFAVLFTTIDRNGRRERRPKHYVFDGQWLAEIDSVQREFIKRQIVPPGERLDPLKLGEGPFPLPVGQPQEQVRARFEVSLLPPPSDGPLAKVVQTYEQLDGLLLVPRPGTSEAKDYERVELLYDRATMLPVGIHVVEIGGDLKTVRLLRPQRNPELDAEAMRKLAIEEPDPRSWAVSVQPWAGQ